MSKADVWTLMCLLMALLFGVLTIVFAAKKEKAAFLVAGFNSLTERQQARYDRAAIARHYQSWLRLVTEGWLLAAALSHWVGAWGFIGAMALMLAACAREMHIDWEKAFEKYLINRQ